MHDPRIFDRYLKVRALAEQGSDGEKFNAYRIQKGLEEAHPWLRVAYAQHKTPAPAPPPPPSQAEGAQRQGPQAREDEGPTGSRWGDIFGFAQDAFRRTREFVDAVNETATGFALADGLAIISRSTRSGNLVVSATLKEADLDELDTFNAMQRVAFRDRALARLREQLDMILGLDAGDDDEEP